MWTLHTVTENVKKYAVFAVVGIIILALLWSIIANLIAYVNRPKYVPPSMGFKQLPPIPFPASAIQQKFTYTLNTVDGKADVVDPASGQTVAVGDRINVYRFLAYQPDLTSLQTAANKVAAAGFINTDGTPIQEKRMTQTIYRWNKTNGLPMYIDMDIGSFNFHVESLYTVYPAVTSGLNVPTDAGAITTAQNFLAEMQLLTTNNDIDPNLTTTTDYTIQNNTLVPASNGAPVLAIRVNFFQKAINNLPIVYPTPPDSLLSFLITGGDTSAQVAEATFTHQVIDTSDQGVSDYPLKQPADAYANLQDGKGYITPGFTGGGSSVSIRSISLAYYIGDNPQSYLMPVYVFTGDNNFVAYVSAVSDSAISPLTPSPSQ